MSTVRTTALQPAASALGEMLERHAAVLEDVELAPRVSPGAAAAISSCDRVVNVETHMPAPAAAAARAVAHSPSGS